MLHLSTKEKKSKLTIPNFQISSKRQSHEISNPSSQISPLSTEQGIPQLTAQNHLAVEKVRNDETSSGD